MCQIFGYTGSEYIEIRDVLREFYSHSDLHPNGWGLALLDGNQANIEREVISANKSAYLEGRLKAGISAPNVLAHIRYATIGNVELNNCHPFTGTDSYGRRWTLIHNGTIFEYQPMDEYVRRQKGETDSERILLYLIDRINAAAKEKNKELTDSERFAVVEELISDIAPGNKLNLLIFDGELLYAHTNLSGSLHYYQGKCATLFSTEPLVKSSVFYGGGHPREKRFCIDDWQEVPVTTLLAYKGADLIHSGKPHGHEYHEDPEAIKHLYLAYSNL